MGEWIGPIGSSVEEDHQADLADPEYRAEYERLEPFERLSRIVVFRRAELGLTQAGLADRMGTTASVISRIESGQHPPSARTIKRLAEALEARAVIGFEFGTPEHPEPQLVRL